MTRIKSIRVIEKKEPRAPKPFPTVEERFWSKVNKRGPTIKGELGPCWLWTGGTDKDGYGVFHPTSDTTVPAHRFSYELAFGPVPTGELVMHRCDNPPCCNPAHYTHGTNADNLGDMAAKGRARGGRRTKDGREPANRRQVTHESTVGTGEDRRRLDSPGAESDATA